MSKLRGHFNRVISMLLILSIMLSIVPVPVFASNNVEAVYLPQAEIDEETRTSGAFYLGSSGVEISENASAPYLFKIGRGGSNLQETEVRLNFIDITAKYGKDYRIRIHDSAVLGEEVQNVGSNTSLLEEIVENKDSIVEENYSDGIVSKDNRDIDTINKEYQEDIEQLDAFLSEQVDGYKEQKEAYIAENGGNFASEEDLTDTFANKMTTTASSLKEAKDLTDTFANKATTTASSLKEAKEIATGLRSDKTPMDGGNSSLAHYTQETLSALSLELGSAYLIVGFAEGETEKYIEIIPEDNNLGDGDRMFSINLFPHSPNAVISHKSGLTVNIIDDEVQDPAIVSFTDTTYYPEDGFIAVTIERTGAINQMVSVYVTSEDATAIQGRDYSQVNTSVVFPYGITERTINIPIRSAYIENSAEFKLILSAEANCSVGENNIAYGLILPDSVSYVMTSAAEDESAGTMLRSDATVTSYFTDEPINLSQNVISAGVDHGGYSHADGNEWKLYTEELWDGANSWAAFNIQDRYDISGVAIDWTKSSGLPCYTDTYVYDVDANKELLSTTTERWKRKTDNIYFEKDKISRIKIVQTRLGGLFGTSPTLTIHSIKPILRPFEITLQEADPLEFLNESGQHVPNTQLSEVMDANHSTLQNASNNGKGTVVKFSGDSFTVTSNSKYSYIQGLKIVNKSTGASTLVCSNLAVGTTSVSVELNNDFLKRYSDYITYSDNGEHGYKGGFAVQPVMGYYDSTVTIHKDYRGQIDYVDDGRIPATEIENGVILTYHKGDTLRFTQTIHDPYAAAYTSSRIRLVTWDHSTADPVDNKRAYDKGTNYCTLINAYSHMEVYPNFDKKDNQVVVRVAKSDLEKFNARMGIFLSPCKEVGNYVEYTVVDSDVFAAGVHYELTAKATKDTDIPVWKKANTSTSFAQGTFYFEATDEIEQNVIDLTCQTADSMAYVLTGNAYYANVALNGKQEGTAWMPASGVHVMIGSEKFGLSDENGRFNTVGMYGVNGMSVCYKIVASGQVSYQTAVLSNQKVSEFGSSGVKVKAYEVNVGTIKAAAMNHASPYVTAVVAANTEKVERGVVSIDDDSITTFTVALNNNGVQYTDSDGTVRTEKVTAVDFVVYEKQTHRLKSVIPGAQQLSENDGLCIWTLSHTFRKGESNSYAASDEIYVRVTTDRVVGNGKGYTADGEEVELEALKQTVYAPVNTGYTFVEENRREPVTHDINLDTDMNFIPLPVIGDMQASFNIKKISLSISALPNGGQRLAVGFVPAKIRPEDTGKTYKISELKKLAEDMGEFGKKLEDEVALGMSSWGVAPVFGIYLDFGLKEISTDAGSAHGLVFIGGGMYLGVTGNFRMVQYFVLGWVPCYFGTEGALTAFMQAGIKTANEDKATVDSLLSEGNSLQNNYDLSFVLQANGLVSAYVGAGLCGTLGVRGGIYLNASYILQAMYPEYDANGLLLGAGIKIWVDAFLFSVPIPALTIEAEKYGYFKQIDYDATDTQMLTQNSDQPEIMVKPRNSENAKWIPNGNQPPNLESTFEPITSTVLMENGYDRADPQLIDLGEGRILLVFLADDPQRDDMERTALMYSVYENGVWSKPVIVQDDGTADFEPDICDAGEKVLISWTSREPNQTYTTETEYLKSLDVYTTTLNKKTLTLGTIERLTDDAFYDYAPTAIYDSQSGDYLVYYLKAEVGTDFEWSVSSTVNESMIVYMLYDAKKGEWARGHYYDNEIKDYATAEYFAAQWGGQRFLSSPIHEFSMNDPVIIDFDAISYYDPKCVDDYEFGSVNGGSIGVYAFTVDEDKNMDTSDDRELFIQLYDFKEHRTYAPIRLTRNNLSDARPQLVKNGGHTYLFWLENHTNILYIDIAKLVKYGIAGDGTLKEPQEYEETDIPDNMVQQTAIYEMHPEAVFFARSAGSEINPTFGSYKAFVDSQDNLFITWLQPVKNEDGNSSQEVYASALTRHPDGMSWSEGVRLTYSNGRFNDEIALITDANGDLLTVGNQYSMELTGDNYGVKDVELVATKYRTVGSLDVDGVEYSNDAPQAGSMIDVTVKIKNTGLKPAEGYTFTAYEVCNGETQNTPVYSVTSQNHITPSSSDFVTFQWTMPDDYENVDELSLCIDIQEAGMAEIERHFTESISIEPVYRIVACEVEQRADGFFATYSIENVGNADAEFSDPLAGDRAVLKFNDIYHKGIEADPYLEVPIGNLKVNEVQTCVMPLEIPGEHFEYGYTNAFMAVQDQAGNTLSSSKSFIISLEHPYQIVINDDMDLTEITLEKGDRLQMSAAYSPSDFFMDAEINYHIKDASIAYMEDGNLVANSVGKTELTVMIVPYGGYKTLNVSVKEKAVAPSENYIETWYTVTLNTNGGNELAPLWVRANYEIGEIEKPVRKGYVFDGWYLDKELTKKADLLARVTSNIVLYAKWIETSNADAHWENPFKDVSSDDWFYESVKFAHQNGLLCGTTENTFAPHENLTRAMLVTVLHRMEDSPVAADAAKFADVPSDAYYSAAVAWAQDNDIVKGISETEFAPNVNITREQIAIIMYRYAIYKGAAVVAPEKIPAFTDEDDISRYAVSAMHWIIGQGIINGYQDGSLKPQNNATRAEAAAILQRFLEKLEEQLKAEKGNL